MDPRGLIIDSNSTERELSRVESKDNWTRIRPNCYKYGKRPFCEREREAMAGLLAWAADVVGGGGPSDGGREGEGRLPVMFTEEQQRYAVELDGKAAALRRSIQDLRLRIPPAHISQRLPDLHAHSLASNAALALQLNAHSTTREQVASLILLIKGLSIDCAPPICYS